MSNETPAPAEAPVVPAVKRKPGRPAAPKEKQKRLNFKGGSKESYLAELRARYNDADTPGHKRLSILREMRALEVGDTELTEERMASVMRTVLAGFSTKALRLMEKEVMREVESRGGAEDA